MGRQHVFVISFIVLERIGRPVLRVFQWSWELGRRAIVAVVPPVIVPQFVQSTKQPFVSIIIVNFNGRQLLEECLPAVFSVAYPKNSYEVIVVDNGSTDDSVPYVRKAFPRAVLLEAHENLGFTGGNNLGYEHAKGEYIVLLNSDVVVDKQWLRELVYTAQDPEVGLATSRLYYNVPFIAPQTATKSFGSSKYSLSFS